MRIMLKEGKQKELIRRYKSNNNLTWKQLSKILNIKENRLKEYVYENCLIPEEVYNKLDIKSRYKRLIIEKKEENWGRIKGGKISRGNTKTIQIPNESIELAEFYGIMLGDGNLTKIKDYKKGTYSARIVGDSRKDKDYLTNFVKPLTEKLFGIKARISVSKVSNALIVEAVGKNIVSFLESKGFKPGDKIRNKLKIPNWIKQKKSFLCSCLRGLYDTDGSCYKLTNQNSYQINFCNKNKRLLKETREALISLEIYPSLISKGEEFNITKKSELRKFLKLISFNNSKHLNKIKVWKIAP